MTEFKRILIPGGMGFVGSSLALLIKAAYPDTEVYVFDNLKRRGSELNLPRLKHQGIHFVHGDLRIREDLMQIPKCDLVIDCCAEPSVLSGTTGSPDYMLQTNLTGTMHCLEYARINSSHFMFISTSRVYPIEALLRLRLQETPTRLQWDIEDGPGYGPKGIRQDFTMQGYRSLYGTSKYCSELLIAEYVANYGLKGIINRCGVLAGPWQFGKVDQGFMALWAAAHAYGRPLKYIGYGGTGKQVRDVLHIRDLFSLMQLEMNRAAEWKGQVVEASGGIDNTISLLELTSLCEKLSNNTVDIGQELQTRSMDLPVFYMDCERTQEQYGWTPKYTIEDILVDIFQWLNQEKASLTHVL
jgi:CDP-paratose 2-epimerase